ncbi:MAG: YggS family pyridoxal phosphate-dependent enzyme [Bacillota bacterium]|nr:YggS family pyridoxal phosphate-dependent enzyme [Bacillota bacterium]
MDIAAALEQVKRNIELARGRSVHAARQVQLLAVSKTQPLEKIAAAYAAGQQHFGENKVQELVEKQQQLPQLNWHLIGHLQRNKVKYVIGKTRLIHSLDSISLAAEIEKRSAAASVITEVLIQVNIAEEQSKSGVFVPELAGFVSELAAYPHIKLRGLMTIGPMVEDYEQIRPVFRELRLLFERERARELPYAEMSYLSMGMSHDYMIAVEEGANIVRVGSSIFGARNYA